MSMIWDIELAGKNLRWFVGSWTVPRWENSSSAAQVIVPVEQLGDLTDEEIGRFVRNAVSHAIECNEAEIEYEKRREENEIERRKSQQQKQRRKQSPGYIYLMHGIGTNWYKIGKTKHLDKRFKPLSTQGPFPLELIHANESGDMKTDEDRWHDIFADKREEGEWFTLSQADIDLFMGK